MGKYDREDVEYFAEPNRQAELISNGVYHGKVRVQAEELINLPRKYPSLNSSNGEKERDILSYCSRHKMKYGFEIENYPDYGMPRRTLTYDACEYEREAEEIRLKHKDKKDYADFIEKKSGMKSNEFYTPIIDSVLYLGQGHYKGRRSLRECFQIPDEIKRYAYDKVQNYSFNLIEADYVIPENYKTELRQFFEVMQVRNNKEKLKELLKREDFENLSLGTKKMIAVHLNHSKFLRKSEEKEDFDMCKAIDDLIKDGKNEGRAESVKNLMETMKWPMEQAMDALKIPKKERNKIKASILR